MIKTFSDFFSLFFSLEIDNIEDMKNVKKKCHVCP